MSYNVGGKTFSGYVPTFYIQSNKKKINIPVYNMFIGIYKQFLLRATEVPKIIY